MLADKKWLAGLGGGGHGLLADKKLLPGLGPMVCLLTRNGWMVVGHRLLSDKKWLEGCGTMVCWLGGDECRLEREECDLLAERDGS